MGKAMEKERNFLGCPLRVEYGLFFFFDGTSKNFCTEFLWMLYDLTVASMKNKDK